MKSRTLATEPTGPLSTPNEHKCLRCAGPLTRIRRRAFDRLVSLFVPIHRYRCPYFLCQWEGNLRVPGRRGHDNYRQRTSRP